MSENINLITIEEAIQDNSKIIITPSLPYKFIRVIVDNVKEVCLSIDKDGVLKCDSWFKTMALQFNYVAQKTNIDLSEGEVVDVYDKLRESGILANVLNMQNRIKEYDVILNILNEEIEEELKANKFEIQMNWHRDNSIEAQIKRLIEKIPSEENIKNLLKTVKSEFKDFDPSKLQFLNDKMKEFGEKEVPSVEQVDKLTDNVLSFMDKKVDK